MKRRSCNSESSLQHLILYLVTKVKKILINNKTSNCSSHKLCPQVLQPFIIVTQVRNYWLLNTEENYHLSPLHKNALYYTTDWSYQLHNKVDIWLYSESVILDNKCVRKWWNVQEIVDRQRETVTLRELAHNKPAIEWNISSAEVTC
jgi:hypothetical protein